MVKYLSNNLEEAKDRLVYSAIDIEDVYYSRGVIVGIESFLELPDELKRYKIADEQKQKEREERAKSRAVPYQAVVEGKTPAPSKSELGL